MTYDLTAIFIITSTLSSNTNVQNSVFAAVNQLIISRYLSYFWLTAAKTQIPTGNCNVGVHVIMKIAVIVFVLYKSLIVQLLFRLEEEHYSNGYKEHVVPFKRPQYYHHLGMDKENENGLMIVPNAMKRRYPCDIETAKLPNDDVFVRPMLPTHRGQEFGYRHPNIVGGNVRVSRLFSGLRWYCKTKKTILTLVISNQIPVLFRENVSKLFSGQFGCLLCTINREQSL